jgi:preprotein translocase SecE subunit
MPETKNVDEKQVQQQPEAPGSGSKPENFLLAARIWTVLLALGWAGTLAFLLTGLSFMGPESVPLGRVHVRPGALAVGVLGGAAVLIGILKKLGDKMIWNRPGLGRAVRMSAFGGIGALTAFGAYALYMAPSIHSLWWTDMLGPVMIFGKALSLKPILFPALGVFLTVMSGVFLILNQDRWADFLIETEGEVKKVSWPGRKEYMGSAMVVVLVVAIVSAFLHYVDMGLSRLMQYWGVGF